MWLAPNSAKIEFCKPDPISRDRAIIDSDFSWQFPVWRQDIEQSFLERG